MLDRMFLAEAMASAPSGQGGLGFGVGVYPYTLPSGISALTGTTDVNSENYGNYQYSDGSIMVFVPKFYYRIGNTSSPRYATYGANAIDIVGSDVYANESAANAAGYAMHRAFFDGGSEKSGFFIDKYIASQNGTSSCRSIKNGVPISLTSNTAYTRSAGMTGCTGITADSVVLARSRGSGFNVASIFMWDAIAKLSFAHAQASSSTTYCAWYDATNNFPKGCNYLLRDANDASVTFTSAGDSGNANKPKTGSASNLAKTTHNGQLSGVVDVNGGMIEVMLGLTAPGSGSSASTNPITGDAYILKRSTALASLTGGWDGSTDAWGTDTTLATRYDFIAGFMPWLGTKGFTYFGNGTEAVFSGDLSGTEYLRSCCGIPNMTGLSATGTGTFGNDGLNQYGMENLFPRGGGGGFSEGNLGVNAGIFYRNFDGRRSNNFTGVGFRAAIYGS